MAPSRPSEDASRSSSMGSCPSNACRSRLKAACMDRGERGDRGDRGDWFELDAECGDTAATVIGGRVAAAGVVAGLPVICACRAAVMTAASRFPSPVAGTSVAQPVGGLASGPLRAASACVGEPSGPLDDLLGELALLPPRACRSSRRRCSCLARCTASWCRFVVSTSLWQQHTRKE